MNNYKKINLLLIELQIQDINLLFHLRNKCIQNRTQSHHIQSSVWAGPFIIVSLFLNQ